MATIKVSVSRLEKTLRATAAALADLETPWALVGGLAVATMAEPRFTRDVDIAISVTDDDAAEQIVWRLQERGFSVQTVIEHVPSGRMGSARLFPPPSVAKGIYVDLLFASCGIEPEIVKDAVDRDIFSNLTIPVATIGHLVAMKLLAADNRNRPQDHDDILSLLENATDSDIAKVRECVSLIAKRGFNRGRDLLERFEAMRSASK